VEALRDAYQRALQELIALCLSCSQRELTPSDFGYADLSIDELNSFFE
jgi:hypothetical protein